MSFWKPETQAPLRPSTAEMAVSAGSAGTGPDEATLNLRARILYLRSYLLMRALIGFIGLALPLVLVVGDGLLVHGDLAVRDSLSAYYYSGVRDVLVGSLSAIAVFLITYKVFERSLNNVFSLIAGFAALAIAFFPTKRPTGATFALTPLQGRLGESTVSAIHYTSAGIFVVSLAIISFFFGIQEGRRPPWRVGGRAMMSPTFWRWFHWSAAAAILLSVAFITVSDREHWLDKYAFLIGEVVAFTAFGVSWLTKGLELDVLLGPGPAQPQLSTVDP